MKKTLRRMVTIMSTLMIAFTCFINLMNAPEAEAAEADSSTEIDTAELAEEMAARFNDAREELGLAPLYIVPYLNEVSEIRAAEIAASNESYSHIRPDGSDSATAIDNSILDCDNVDEILLRGSNNVKEVFNCWQKSPNYWSIITNPEATHIGICAYYAPDSSMKWYWTAEIVTLPEDYVAENQRLPFDEEAIVLGIAYMDDDYMSSPVVIDSESVPADEVICGDINGDGVIDSFDLILVKRYLNGTMEFTSTQLAAADMLKNGSVTDIDAEILKMYILGEIDSLNVA